MTKINGRALHYVLKIGDRKRNLHFFRDVLGMKVLRHEEFKEGCEAECNGPYENRWSKTMVGYGPESSHFVIELTYNYGVKSYELGNDLGGIVIKSSNALKRAAENNYPITKGVQSILNSPDGYKFVVLDEPQPVDTDPVQRAILNVQDMAASKQYWQDTLEMVLRSQSPQSIVLSYGENQASLELALLDAPLNLATGYGRIAFAVPGEAQPYISEKISARGYTILKNLITLDTPGKATVRVIILADPDGHEICFVDEEGFSELSQVESNANSEIEKFVKKDPFQEQ